MRCSDISKRGRKVGREFEDNIASGLREKGTAYCLIGVTVSIACSGKIQERRRRGSSFLDRNNY